jgi:hypothetical protein
MCQSQLMSPILEAESILSVKTSLLSGLDRGVTYVPPWYQLAVQTRLGRAAAHRHAREDLLEGSYAHLRHVKQAKCLLFAEARA